MQELKWKKIGNNTWQAVDEDGTRHVKLHNTVIFKRYEDGRTVLNNGGYVTHTTKKRMNALLEGTPYSVFQKEFNWYLEDRRRNTVTPFKDGKANADWCW